MDLTSFAVERKLANPRDELFDLVVAGKDIPASVLSDSMRPLLDSRHNTAIETMVHDYPKYLQDNVQLNIIRQGDGKFKIAGHIDDNVAECINTIHHIDNNEMIRQYIKDLMQGMNADKDVVIDQLELGDTPYEPQSRNVGDELVQEGTISSQPATQSSISNNELTTPDVPMPTKEAVGDVEPLTDYVDGLDVGGNQPEPDIDGMYKQPEPDMAEMSESQPSIARATPDEASVEPGLDFNPAPLASSPIDAVPEDGSAELPTFEEPEFEEPEGQPNTMAISNPAEFKRAYDWLVGHIKDKELDKKLPGLHIN